MKRYSPALEFNYRRMASDLDGLSFGWQLSNSVRRRQPWWASLALLLALFAGRLYSQTITEFQPRISWGGRCVSVTVNPTNDSVSVVASESGGLWRTVNGGATWSHLDTLPMFRLVDVRYLADGRTLITTGWADSSATSRGGIWRSTDGGNSWTLPATANPGCTPRWHAHGIAIDPNTGTIYVGTSCGVAISTNSGADWQHTALPGADGRILSVAAHGNGIVDVAGPDGHRRSTNNASSFGPVSIGLPTVEWSHGLAASPLEPGVVFLAAGTPSPCPNSGAATLFQGAPDGAGGMRWTAVTTNICRGGGRGSWVAATQLAQSTGTQVQVYFGSGLQIYRQAYLPGRPGPRLRTNGWTTLSIDHSDQNGMAFSPQSGLPTWIVSDAGVHKPTDFGSVFAILFGVPIDRVLSLLGSTWSISGNAATGFNALQLYEVTGQISLGTSTDLYLGIQDMAMPASRDAGVTWPYDSTAEGFHVQVQRYAPITSNQVVTFIYPPTPNLITGRNFQNVQGWTNPPPDTVTNVTGNPTLIAPEVFVQFTQPTPNVAGFALNLTTNRGQTWLTNLATINFSLVGWPHIARSGEDIVLYQAINRDGAFFSGANIGLLKITGLRRNGTRGPIRVESADIGLGRIGIYANGEGTFVVPEVFGVDPNNSAHLIAADILARQMMVSTNGGASWFPDPALTDLVIRRDPVSGTPEFSFGLPQSQDLFGTPGAGSQAHVIAFDPFQRGHILVGTEAAGIIRSTDGGATWSRLPGSERVTAISSFFFRENSYSDPMNTVYVSTYGRGLWKLRFPVGIRCPFQICQKFDPWTGKWIRDPITGDLVDLDLWVNPDFCPICRWLAIDGGHLRGLRLDEHQRVASLTLDGGRVVASSTDGVPVALDPFTTEFSTEDGVFEGCPGCELILKQGGVIKGLILEEGTLKGIFAGFGDFPFEDTLAAFDPLPPKLELLPEAQGPVGPYLHLIAGHASGSLTTAGVGSEVTVVGVNFCGKTECPPVRLELAGEVLAESIPVDPQGSFQFKFTVKGALGLRRLTATQRLDSKTVLEHSTELIVPVMDQEEAGLEVELTYPNCVNTTDVILAGSARGPSESSAKIAKISFTVNGGPETIVCKSCGENPVFALAAPLLVDCHENIILVTVVEEGTGTEATRRRVVRRDSKPPEIGCPPVVTAICSDPAGAVVGFAVTATDGCTANPTVYCEPPSGSVFPPGTTVVKCVAFDECGNETRCEFPVIVTCQLADTTPPKIACSADQLIACGGPDGSHVEFAVSAVDDQDSTPKIECFPPSGSLFPPGTTVVRCVARDASGNESECKFIVRVTSDDQPPKLLCPSDITVDCADPNGAKVEFQATATSLCAKIQALTYTPPSGSIFYSGETTVRCVATDTQGLKSECSFRVNVVPASLTIDLKFVIRWNCGVLESAPDIAGPWSPVNEPLSHLHQANPSDQRRFFRLIR